MGRITFAITDLMVGERMRAVAVLVVMACLSACSASTLPVGHAKRAVDPAGFPQAVSGQGWQVAAVKVTEGPGGVEYSSTQLMPVLLVFKNQGPGQPQVILEDVRAVGENAEYLVYTPDEAMGLASQRTTGRKVANTAKSGTIGAAIGAAIGAGAGAVAFALTGQNHPEYIWLGAAGGGAAGGLTGMALSDSSFPAKEREAILADLKANAWQEDPITPGTTRSGYLLIPANLGVKSVRIIVREGDRVEVRKVAIASQKDYASISASPPAAAVKPVQPVKPEPGDQAGADKAPAQEPGQGAQTPTPSPAVYEI